MTSDKQKAETVAGMSVICGMVVGFTGFAVALLALVTGNVIGAGVCLGAAALAFGLVANASWRR